MRDQVLRHLLQPSFHTFTSSFHKHLWSTCCVLPLKETQTQTDSSRSSHGDRDTQHRPRRSGRILVIVPNADTEAVLQSISTRTSTHTHICTPSPIVPVHSHILSTAQGRPRSLFHTHTNAGHFRHPQRSTGHPYQHPAPSRSPPLAQALPLLHAQGTAHRSWTRAQGRTACRLAVLSAPSLRGKQSLVQLLEDSGETWQPRLPTALLSCAQSLQASHPKHMPRAPPSDASWPWGCYPVRPLGPNLQVNPRFVRGASARPTGTPKVLGLPGQHLLPALARPGMNLLLAPWEEPRGQHWLQTPSAFARSVLFMGAFCQPSTSRPAEPAPCPTDSVQAISLQ